MVATIPGLDESAAREVVETVALGRKGFVSHCAASAAAEADSPSTAASRAVGSAAPAPTGTAHNPAAASARSPQCTPARTGSPSACLAMKPIPRPPSTALGAAGLGASPSALPRETASADAATNHPDNNASIVDKPSLSTHARTRCRSAPAAANAHRAAGALVRLFGHPVSRITALRHDDIHTDADGTSWLQMTHHRLLLPDAVAALPHAQCQHGTGAAMLARASSDGTRGCSPAACPDDPPTTPSTASCANTCPSTSAAPAAPPSPLWPPNSSTSTSTPPTPGPTTPITTGPPT